MSGHSKWSKIKRQKGAQDAKRSNIFTKLGNAIALAAREGGGDIDTNFKLRLAVDKAKQANMPKQNINRAIDRGTGKGENGNIEQLTYEGFGPDNIGVIVEVVTDNKNRSVSNLKHIFSKHGGSMASNGSVTWMFKQKGVIVCDDIEKLSETDELKLIDMGVEDWEISDNKLIVYTNVSDLQKVVDKLTAQKFKVGNTELEYIANETQGVADEKKWENFTDALEDDDDVSNFYTNAA